MDEWTDDRWAGGEVDGWTSGQLMFGQMTRQMDGCAAGCRVAECVIEASESARDI
jgi:hypothetical protein